MTHICVIKLTIIGSDNGLSPGRRQAIIWTNAGISLFKSLGTNSSEMLTIIQTFSFKKMHLKMLPGKWWPSCLGLNVLTTRPISCWIPWMAEMNYHLHKEWVNVNIKNVWIQNWLSYSSHITGSMDKWFKTTAAADQSNDFQYNFLILKKYHRTFTGIFRFHMDNCYCTIMIMIQL